MILDLLCCHFKICHNSDSERETTPNNTVFFPSLHLMLHVSVIVPSAGGVCVSEESGSPSASARLSGWLDALGPGRPRAQTQTELAHLGELRSKFDCG